MVKSRDTHKDNNTIHNRVKTNLHKEKSIHYRIWLIIIIIIISNILCIHFLIQIQILSLWMSNGMSFGKICQCGGKHLSSYICVRRGKMPLHLHFFLLTIDGRKSQHFWWIARLFFIWSFHLNINILRFSQSKQFYGWFNVTTLENRICDIKVCVSVCHRIIWPYPRQGQFYCSRGHRTPLFCAITTTFSNVSPISVA